MACGHVLAVTTTLGLGTLQGSVWVLYAIGAAIAVPSWWLAGHSWRSLASDDDRGRPALALNAWLSATLLALGIVNLPLAVPGFLNISYHLHSRRSVGWAILALAAIVHGGLFVGGLIFLASGQSFEQFQGLQ